jgi:hypothetical protein
MICYNTQWVSEVILPVVSFVLQPPRRMPHYLPVLLLWLIVATAAGQEIKKDSSAADKNERPSKPRFIAELDQRFFYFKDRRQPLFSNSTNVWGVRAGLLWPINVKTGVGFYYTNHAIDEPWGDYQAINRRLTYVTAYVEPYFYRRRYWELSAPIEAGLGSAQYNFTHPDVAQSRSSQTLIVPLTVGLSVSLKFPMLWGFKPLRWFGVNLITGYRYTLRDEVVSRQITLNGLYYSISPAIFLDRIYADYETWRKRHRQRKEKK